MIDTSSKNKASSPQNCYAEGVGIPFLEGFPDTLFCLRVLQMRRLQFSSYLNSNPVRIN